jgi:1-acyl-sn-glycerol-3-phosphate acyltransferase
VLKYTNKLKLWKTGLDRRHIREEVRDVIYTQLVAFENQSKEKTDVCKK